MLFSLLQSISLLSQASSVMYNENKIILTNCETGEKHPKGTSHAVAYRQMNI